MQLTKKQTEDVLSNYLSQDNGLNDVLEIFMNSMMLSERNEYLMSHGDNKGNGFRLGKVFGHGAQLELKIPRDRKSEFYPTILALFRDQEEYLKEVSFQLYSKGLTTRDISEVMETIYGNHYSRSTISNFSKSFYEEMEVWRNRSLEPHYKALFIDGLFVKVKRDSKYENECFYIILGLKEDLSREIIAIVNAPTESASSWENIFDDIIERGVKSVGIIVSDSLSGVDKAIAKKFPKTAHQKCTVHLQRNLMSRVRPDDKSEIARDLSSIFNPDNPDNSIELALRNFEEFKIKWELKYSGLKSYFKKFDFIPYLTFLNYDYRVRRMLYTTNWIERFNKSARRTLKVRGAFPTEESVLALITSVAISIGEKTYSYKLYNFKFEEKLSRLQSEITNS